MTKQEERQMDKDLEQMDLDEVYNNSLKTINHCIKLLVEEKDRVTKLYEAMTLDNYRRHL